MLKIFTTATALALSTTAAFAAGHATMTGYGLGADGTSLTVFTDMSAPDAAQTLPLTGGMVDAIAYRPVTGELLGFSKAGKVFVIDTETGALSDTGATFAPEISMGTDAAVALDFNNAIDAVRAVSSDGVNVVYFPSDFGDDKANSVRRFKDLAFAEGDVNVGATPMVFANAYTNAVNGAKQESTFQYALDGGLDALVSLANNEGTLTTVAPLTLDGAPVDVAMTGGFDIVSAAAGEDTGIALLSMEGGETSGLYQIDLATGALTLMGDTGTAGFTGFAAKLN
jgi:hypothetical protein